MRSPARSLVLIPLTSIALWAGPIEQAEADDSLAGSVTERAHRIEVVPGSELTTLEVTRTFLNPTFDPQSISLTISLPCDAIVDHFELRGPDDARGRATWVPGKLIDPSLADDRFSDFRFDSEGDTVEADTLAVLARDSGCSADLDLFPVPAMRERSVRYRVQLPSAYSEGRYTTTLPIFALDLKGAQLDIRDPAQAGFELRVDDKPISSQREFSGSTPHTLTLAPTDASQARVSLAALDLRELGVHGSTRSVLAAELDLPLHLVDLPPVRRVVVVVDASHSFGSSQREPMLELAAAYLDALALAQPNAGVEVLAFDRAPRRTHGEFIDPARASEQLREATFETHNGSEPGLALTAARELLTAARQPGEAGVDWILLIGDLELRESYSLAAELDAAAASDVRMHVLEPGSDPSLMPKSIDDPWTEIAQATGGGYFGYTKLDYALPRDGAELLSPNRVRDLRLIRTDAKRDQQVVELDAELAAGESTQWLELLESAAPERVSFAASSWAKPLTWSTKTSAKAEQRWAGILTAGEPTGLELDETELSALAKFAQAVTPWTSMIAEAEFGGRSPIGELWGTGGSFFGRSSCGTHCGFGHAHTYPGIRFDLSILESAIEQQLGQCEALEPGSLTLEILDREIVVVESSQACAREAIWQLDLRAWPSFGHPIVQVRFDQLGVQQLQMSSSYEQPASFAD